MKEGDSVFGWGITAIAVILYLFYSVISYIGSETSTPETPVYTPVPTYAPLVAPQYSTPTPTTVRSFLSIPQNNVYYSNCSEAHADGAYNITPDQPGYRSALDRDSDGYACE